MIIHNCYKFVTKRQTVSGLTRFDAMKLFLASNKSKVVKVEHVNGTRVERTVREKSFLSRFLKG